MKKAVSNAEVADILNADDRDELALIFQKKIKFSYYKKRLFS
jgi:hypothetical protein